jgi:hypothetical protein
VESVGEVARGDRPDFTEASGEGLDELQKLGPAGDKLDTKGLKGGAEAGVKTRWDEKRREVIAGRPELAVLVGHKAWLTEWVVARLPRLRLVQKELEHGGKPFFVWCFLSVGSPPGEGSVGRLRENHGKLREHVFWGHFQDLGSGEFREGNCLGILGVNEPGLVLSEKLSFG